MSRAALTLCAMSVALSACAEDYEAMAFTAQGTDIIAQGDIDGGTMDRFFDVYDDHPDATRLVLRYVGGSVDDAANVVFAREIHDLGLETHVPSDGLVASGGTDLFLAGTVRSLAPSACVGVHSWAAEDFTATDLPRDDAEHDRYLDYYDDIDIDGAFYWFTIDAAPADGMHWISASEADQFNVSTSPAPRMGSAATCDAR